MNLQRAASKRLGLRDSDYEDKGKARSLPSPTVNKYPTKKLYSKKGKGAKGSTIYKRTHFVPRIGRKKQKHD